LTEQQIIRAALPFIRSHYKYRPRGPGGMETRYDVATKEGLIADGYIAFESETGAPFIVTVESTSQQSREEVIYTIQNNLLSWDSVALASLLVAGGYAWVHGKGFNTTQHIGEIPTVLLLIGAISIGLFSFRILLGWMRRYRYIYAIEQFKRYQVTEQWIALGEDVFKRSLDKDYFELQEQCVDNGIGLVIVNTDLTVEIVFTPSREAVHTDRAVVAFGDRATVVKKSKRKKAAQWLKQNTSRLSKARPTIGLGRYRAGFYKQLITLSLGLSIIGGIFYNEWRDSPIAYVDEATYQRDQLIQSKKIRPESSDYFIEEGEKLYSDSISGNYLSLEESPGVNQNGNNNNQIANSGELLELNANPVNGGKASQEIRVGTAAGGYMDYDCERFYNFTGAVYLVQDGVFAEVATAMRRIELLTNAGFTANLMQLSCFGNEPGYAVYFDLMYSNKSEAQTVARKYQKLLKARAIPYGELKIRTLKRTQ